MWGLGIILPLGDEGQSPVTPVVNYGIIALNVLMFIVVNLILGEDALLALAFTPSEGSIVTPITSMFVHAGVMHLGGNMLFLWIFGDNVEGHFGHGKFIIGYLLTGIAATFGHCIFCQDHTIPALGSSGAISGVMGAYIILFPRNQIRVLVYLRVYSLPAWMYLGFWIGLQVLWLLAGDGYVSYGAHVGGFAAGGVWALISRLRIVGHRPAAPS